MTRMRFLLFAFLVTVLCAQARTIEDATSRADGIVVGSIETRMETDDNVSFDVSVTRVIKGEGLPSPLHIKHAWKRRVVELTTDPSEIGGHFEGIWFLKRTGDSWDVLVINGPDGLMPSLYLPANGELPPPPYQYSSTAPATDKIVSEVAASVRAHEIHPETLLYSLEGLNTPLVSAVLNDFLQSPNVSVRAIALSGLLARNDHGSISKLTQMWPSIRQDTGKSLVISAIRDSFRDTTPASVLQLAGLANESSSSPDLRAAAIWALTAIHTRESLPFLASLLSSSDASERVNAVIGLLSFANDCPMQTPANVASMDYIQFKNPSSYRTAQTIAAYAFGPMDSERESELVAFWTEWWNQNKASVLNE